MVASQKPRDEILDNLDGSRFDAVVIGGGINGVAVARDAALRGLSVCLFEQGDFAAGTSSKSTKIAHGGLRYLRNLEFGLVRESQRERLRLRALLPHLVMPQSFCYPIYRDGTDSAWKVRLGLTAYDLLAGLRNPERHKALSVSDALRDNPALRSDGLTSALRYWDDRMDDARICLETALSAERAGAVCLSYTRALRARRRNGAYELDYEDAVTGKGGTVRAGAIVNCGGPWADRVLGEVLGEPGKHLAPTKGVHLVVPRIDGLDALILQNPRDERTFFAIPWDGATLIGTTDTHFEGDPDSVKVEPEDIDYLIDAAALRAQRPHPALRRDPRLRRPATPRDAAGRHGGCGQDQPPPPRCGWSGGRRHHGRRQIHDVPPDGPGRHRCTPRSPGPAEATLRDAVPALLRGLAAGP